MWWLSPRYICGHVDGRQITERYVDSGMVIRMRGCDRTPFPLCSALYHCPIAIDALALSFAGYCQFLVFRELALSEETLKFIRRFSSAPPPSYSQPASSAGIQMGRRSCPSCPNSEQRDHRQLQVAYPVSDLCRHPQAIPQGITPLRDDLIHLSPHCHIHQILECSEL